MKLFAIITIASLKSRQLVYSIKYWGSKKATLTETIRNARKYSLSTLFENSNRIYHTTNCIAIYIMILLKSLFTLKYLSRYSFILVYYVSFIIPKEYLTFPRNHRPSSIIVESAQAATVVFSGARQIFNNRYM